MPSLGFSKLNLSSQSSGLKNESLSNLAYLVEISVHQAWGSGLDTLGSALMSYKPDSGLGALTSSLSLFQHYFFTF